MGSTPLRERLRRINGPEMTSGNRLALVGLTVVQVVVAFAMKAEGRPAVALFAWATAIVCPIALIWDWALYRERNKP